MNFTKKVLLIILFSISSIIIYDFSSFSEKNDEVMGVQAQLEVLEINEILVSFLPISKGEATIIQLPNNDFYLIDTGYVDTSDELISLLRNHGVKSIKGVILTNSFEEHIGGMEEVLQQFAVESIYLPELIINTFNFSTPFQTKIKKIKVNDVIELYTEVKILVLGPNEPLSLSPQANSLVFQLSHKNVRFLFTSDINEEIEKRLVELYQLKSEILKVSDFGSNAGSNPEFLKEVDAHIGIIFSSDPDLYKISEDVFERLHESWTDIYLLNRDGGIRVISDGDNYQIDNVRND